jgi:hypothetical protein
MKKEECNVEKLRERERSGRQTEDKTKMMIAN